MDITQLVENYHKDNDIRYELRAVNGDGEVLVKYTDEISADDVASYAGLMDEKIMQMAIEADRDKKEYLAEATAEAEMERMIYG